MKRQDRLQRTCEEFNVVAVYLFGSRADDGLRLLQGDGGSGAGSDLDVGVVFPALDPRSWHLADLQVAMEDVFSPLQVDLVPLQRVDALFQWNAIDGHRVATTDSTRADEYELLVMRRAAELLPIQRRLEEEEFGVSTT
jgi:predicted nucleotidyltransferase